MNFPRLLIAATSISVIASKGDEQTTSDDYTLRGEVKELARKFILSDAWTPFGEKTAEELNRVGIMVENSQVPERTLDDKLKPAKVPRIDGFQNGEHSLRIDRESKAKNRLVGQRL